MQLNVDLNSLLHQLYSRRPKEEADSVLRGPKQSLDLESKSLFLDYFQRRSLVSSSQFHRGEMSVGLKREDQQRAPSHLQLTESHFEPNNSLLRKKPRKPRTIFTARQLLELERRFENQKYLTSTERSCLAFILGLSDEQIKVWFQNRRSKWKRGSGRTERNHITGKPTNSRSLPVSPSQALSTPLALLNLPSQPPIDSLPLLSPFLLPFLNVCESSPFK
ncbi:hypothetical protein ACHWQZ_G009587 [Mnemiopsis leidyi]